jgi:transposase
VGGCGGTLHTFVRTGCVLEHFSTHILVSKLEPLKERGWMHQSGLAFASMSQNITTTTYAGIDIAKAKLDLSIGGVRHCFNNDFEGHTKLLKIITQTQTPVQAIMEATGGYEAALVAFLHGHQIALSVVQPARVRFFARAMSQLAKTDPIDADVLAAFGQAVRPAPTMPVSGELLRLIATVNRRRQLVETRVQQTNQAEHYSDKLAIKQNKALLGLLKKQIDQCDKAIAEQLADDAALAWRSERLQEVSGIGPVIAATLIAHMPELGSLSAEGAAALAGVAPYNNDSGPSKGTRSIRGGRKEIRCALYMAAMSAVRRDGVLKAFYLRLRSAGKKPMVALTAAMRKLIVLLNHMIKHPEFKLQNGEQTLP